MSNITKGILAAIIIFLGIFFWKDCEILGVYLTTDSPPEYQVRNMKELIACAAESGFIINPPPMLRIMKRPYSAELLSGYAYKYLNIISLTDYASYETLAHELGHIVDFQTHRKGHSFFVGKEKMDEQVFANEIREIILNNCRKVQPAS